MSPALLTRIYPLNPSILTPETWGSKKPCLRR